MFIFILNIPMLFKRQLKILTGKQLFTYSIPILHTYLMVLGTMFIVDLNNLLKFALLDEMTNPSETHLDDSKKYIFEWFMFIRYSILLHRSYLLSDNRQNSLHNVLFLHNFSRVNYCDHSYKYHHHNCNILLH